ncbi:hypothetical protein HY469_03515 [Candidatus Roizmanbacteria bacterium]|nr:hypothetical protein [Candidatus Roizmanbacteria bacterium]
MKKIILPIIMVVFIAALVAGQLLPFPITGKITGYNVDGQIIEIKNMRTGIAATTDTSGSGEFLYDWMNSNNDGGISRYMGGDQFKVMIQSCSGDSACSKTITYSGQSELYFLFDLNKIFADMTPDSETQALPECPASDQTQLGYAAISIFMAIIAVIGGGWQFYKNRAGGVTMLHRHRGIVGYHDPNISHNNPLYRHRRFKDDPVGHFKDIEKIEKYGDVNYKS